MKNYLIIMLFVFYSTSNGFAQARKFSVYPLNTTLSDTPPTIVTEPPPPVEYSGVLLETRCYGTNNRFHNWFGQVLHLNFGNSIIDGQQVFTKINSSLKWTLLYIFIAFFLTYGLAIPLGIYMASHNESRIKIFLEWKLLGLYSVPLFWLSTLAVVFLTSSEITGVFNFFPSSSSLKHPVIKGKLLHINHFHFIEKYVCRVEQDIVIAFGDDRGNLH